MDSPSELEESELELDDESSQDSEDEDVQFVTKGLGAPSGLSPLDHCEWWWQ